MCPFTTASSYTQLKGIKNPGGLLSKLPRYLIYRGCKRAICLGIRLNNCLLPLRPLRIVVDSIALTHNDHMITIRFNNWLIKSYFWKLKKKTETTKKNSECRNKFYLIPLCIQSSRSYRICINTYDKSSGPLKCYDSSYARTSWMKLRHRLTLGPLFLICKTCFKRFLDTWVFMTSH